jgi:hypothetical protein
MSSIKNFIGTILNMYLIFGPNITKWLFLQSKDDKPVAAQNNTKVRKQ